MFHYIYQHKFHYVNFIIIERSLLLYIHPNFNIRTLDKIATYKKQVYIDIIMYKFFELYCKL